MGINPHFSIPISSNILKHNLSKQIYTKMNTLRIGLILKPQGINGEVKVEPLTSDINRYKNLIDVIIDGKNFKVARVKIATPFVYVLFDGILDRNLAETLRNKYIEIDREDAIIPQENTYLIADLIGSNLVDEEGKKIGEIADVTEAKTPYLTVYKVSKKIMRFPLLKDVIKSFSVEKKEMVVNTKRLNEVSVYED